MVWEEVKGNLCRIPIVSTRVLFYLIMIRNAKYNMAQSLLYYNRETGSPIHCWWENCTDILKIVWCCFLNRLNKEVQFNLIIPLLAMYVREIKTCIEACTIAHRSTIHNSWENNPNIYQLMYGWTKHSLFIKGIKYWYMLTWWILKTLC